MSSYTYTWAIGVPGYPPLKPLDHRGLLARAASLGVDTVQFADNLPLHRLDPRNRAAVAGHAADLGVRIEVGTRGIGKANLCDYVEIAREFGSPFVRTVIERPGHMLTPSQAVAALRPVRSCFVSAGMRLAIENHDRYTAQELADVVQELGTDWVGVCLDTVNSFGALEGPEAVVRVLAPLTINVHVKDFVIERPPHMMGFVLEGRAAGAGSLDIPWLFAQLPVGDELSAIIELWTPPERSVVATIAKEANWAEKSVRYLADLLHASDT